MNIPGFLLHNGSLFALPVLDSMAFECVGGWEEHSILIFDRRQHFDSSGLHLELNADGLPLVPSITSGAIASPKCLCRPGCIQVWGIQHCPESTSSPRWPFPAAGKELRIILGTIVTLLPFSHCSRWVPCNPCAVSANWYKSAHLRYLGLSIIIPSTCLQITKSCPRPVLLLHEGEHFKRQYLAVTINFDENASVVRQI